MTRSYRITHHTAYDYDQDVTGSFGRAHLIPRETDGQTCRAATVTVTPAAAEQREHLDWFGNRSTYFAVSTPHRSLSVLAESEVTVSDPPPREPTSSWEAVRDRLAAGRAGAAAPDELVQARGCALPSPRLRPLPAVADYARPSFRAGRPLDEATTDLIGRIHRDFRYVAGSTTVGSTVAELLDRGEGVCQDFAHLAIAALRSVGLAARYVSGYLETTPPPGRERLVGADASHAWVSVFTGSGWLDLDPTNDRLVDASYVQLALGRDYADVPPLKGVIFTDSAESVLRVAVDILRLDPG
jgi:transglutaminase-like putative cysteine protease